MTWMILLLGVATFPQEAPSGLEAPQPVSPTENLDFNRDIRPILSDRCFACHGPDQSKREGGLRLDEESQAKAVRKRGTAIVPGKPGESLLVKRILSQDTDEVMPPPRHGKDLTNQQKKTLETWIAQGARWEKPWALKPLRPRNQGDSIDALLEKSLAKQGLRLSPPADPVTLYRRLHFDSTGLPPTERLTENWDARAYTRKVDELLASDAHAERMAAWWLDLVRFADTVGYHGDQDHASSPYRDWVIDAFAQNMRFDQFTRMQLAGDLLGLAGDEATDGLIASCYNRLLQTSHEGGVQAKEYLAIYQADRVRNISSVWMAATMGCSQCHTHKFDPYTIKDFYSLAAYFADIDEEKHLRGGGGDTVPTKRPPEIKVVVKRDRETLALLKKQLEDAQKETKAPQTTVDRINRQIKQLSAGRMVMVTQAIEPRTVRVLARGNWMDEMGEIVVPAIPEFLGKAPQSGKRSTRLDLANWLTDTKTGIGERTARVIANRVWALLFGEGLSPSMEDFGSQGEAPAHPELLDHLARILIDSGWNIRTLVREIVLSRAYRQSSRETPSLREKDPQNAFFARQNSFRLSAEMVRDNALAISGLLNRKVGGPSFKPYQPQGYYDLLNFPKRGYQPSKGADQYRRGLYIHWQRQFLHPMLRAFDAPSREECTVKRPRSNTPQAALVLLNDPTFLEAARALAQQTVPSPKADKKPLDQTKLVDHLFIQVTGRSPTDAEKQELVSLYQEVRRTFAKDKGQAEAFLRSIPNPVVPGNDATEELATWTFVCRALLNLAETNTRN